MLKALLTKPRKLDVFYERMAWRDDGKNDFGSHKNYKWKMEFNIMEQQRSGNQYGIKHTIEVCKLSELKEKGKGN